MTSEAIILAGGFGTRLRSVVSDVPKPLANIAGKPFLCWLLEGLAKQNITSVILSTGYMGDIVAETLGCSYSGISLKYVQEEEPLGTGGALWGALAHSSEERVFVMNGDTWLGLPLREMESCYPDADIVIASREIDNCSRYGGLYCDGRRVLGLLPAVSDEPALINAGIYLVRTDLPSRHPMPQKFGFEAEIIGHGGEFNIYHFPTTAPFLDIGTPEDFMQGQTLIPSWAK